MLVLRLDKPEGAENVLDFEFVPILICCECKKPVSSDDIIVANTTGLAYIGSMTSAFPLHRTCDTSKYNDMCWFELETIIQNLKDNLNHVKE